MVWRRTGRALLLEERDGVSSTVEEYDRPERDRIVHVFGSRAERDAAAATYLVAAATIHAAERVELRAGRSGSRWPLERDVVRATCDAAAKHSDVALVADRRVAVPGWDPQPGNTDLIGWIGTRRLFVAEFKIDVLDETIWDALKVASVVSGGLASAEFLLCAARRWDPRRVHGAQLFGGESPALGWSGPLETPS